MFCKHCGKEIPENSKFCRYCGENVDISYLEKKSDKMKQSEVEQSQEQDQEQPNFIVNYFNVIKKYVEFTGRASRREYWMFILANILIYLGLGLFEGLLGVYPESDDSVFVTIYQLFILLPSLSVGVRRMHDANESGWALVIPIFNLIVALRKGNPESNKFGPPPKY